MQRLLLEFVVRSTLIAVGTGLALLALRIRSAAAKHAAWAGVMFAMLLLPAWMAWGPKASLPVLPAQPAAAVIDVTPVAFAEVSIATPTQPANAPESRWDWTAVLLALYTLGAVALLLRLTIGTLRACRLTSASAPVTVGFFKPRIILPQSSSEWPQAQFEIVLAHVRAH
jgi:hypothetical protein